MQTPRGADMTGGGGGGASGLKVCRWSFLITIKNLKIIFKILIIKTSTCKVLVLACCPVRWPCNTVTYFPCADGCQAGARLCEGPGGLVSGA